MTVRAGEGASAKVGGRTGRRVHGFEFMSGCECVWLWLWLWLLKGYERIFCCSALRALLEHSRGGSKNRRKKGTPPRPRSFGGRGGRRGMGYASGARRERAHPVPGSSHRVLRRRCFTAATMSSQEDVSRRHYSMDVASYRLPFYFWNAPFRSFRRRSRRPRTRLIYIVSVALSNEVYSLKRRPSKRHCVTQHLTTAPTQPTCIYLDAERRAK